MKNNIVLILLFCAFFFTSCEETVPPLGGGTGGPTGGDKQARSVLIEEFTGVQCVQCPAGSARIEELLDLNGENLIALSIHGAGGFSIPVVGFSTDDFRSPEAFAMGDLLGPLEGYPTATVNRKQFPSEAGRMIGLTKWAGYIDQELQEETKVKVTIDHTYDDATRNVDLTVNLEFYENVAEALVLNVVITETNVQNYQLTPQGDDLNYIHKHIMRKKLTPVNGDPISGTTNAGDTKQMSYSFTLPEAPDVIQTWNADNCGIIAYVSWEGPAELNVLQAHEVKLK